MKIKAVAILVCFLITERNFLLAQDHQVDSLKKVLLTQKEDTNKVSTLIAFCINFEDRNDNLNEMQYARKALNLSSKIHFKKGEGNAYLRIGVAFYQQENYADALKNYSAALQIYEELKNKKYIAKLYQMIGGVISDEGNIKEAMGNYKTALKLREEIKDSAGIAQTFNSIGELDLINGDYDESLQKHFVALKICKALGGRANSWSLPYCYETIADVYLKKGDLVSSDNVKTISANMYNEAIKYYLLALKSWEEIDNKFAMAELCFEIGNTEIKLENLSAAKIYIQKGLQLATVTKDNQNLQEGYFSQSNLDELQGHYKQALEHYKMHALYLNRFYNDDSKKKTLQSKMQYEFDKKESSAKAEQEKKDALTNAEISKQKVVRNFSVAGAFAFLSLGGFVFYNFRKRKKIESQQALSNERLRISRELHDDIGSTLGSIAVYSDVAKNRSVKNENPVEVLSKIGTASRELIEKMSDIVWSLNPDNETFEQLQNRMQGFAAMILTPRNITIEFKTGDELKTLQLTSEQRKNIFLIYKEAIHNIVKYAECKNVLITLSKSTNNLSLVIKDDGKGFDSDNNVAYNGNGIKNMKARAKDMNALFNIVSKINEGTAIELSIKI